MDLIQVITTIGVLVSIVISVLNYIYSHQKRAQTDRELEMLKAVTDILVDKEKKIFDERSKAYPDICQINYRTRVKCREIVQSPNDKKLKDELSNYYNEVYNILYKYVLLMKNDNIFLLQHNFKNMVKDFLDCLNNPNKDELESIYSKIDAKQSELEDIINVKLNSEILELKELNPLHRKI